MKNNQWEKNQLIDLQKAKEAFLALSYFEKYERVRLFFNVLAEASEDYRQSAKLFENYAAIPEDLLLLLYFSILEILNLNTQGEQIDAEIYAKKMENLLKKQAQEEEKEKSEADSLLENF
jgi:hypothetical protein